MKIEATKVGSGLLAAVEKDTANSLRILHVIRTLDPSWGGPMEGVKHITGQALARHHKPEIATFDDPAAPWLANVAVPVHALGSQRTVYGYSKKLGSWLTQNLPRFDRVIVHGVWHYHSYSIWKATRRIPTQYCVFTHGYLDPWFQAKYPLKHIKKVIYWKLIEHKVLRDAKAVLFTSGEEMRLAGQGFSPYHCRRRVVGYGIPPVPKATQSQAEVIRDLTASYPHLRGRKYLLFLARIHEKKGIDILIRAYARVKSWLPQTALVIAGEGNPTLVSTLKNLAADLSISEDLLWTGGIYGDAKWNLMRAADAYVLPSHQENFGISVAESLACGTPVLISNKVNIWKEIQGANGGFVGDDNEEGTQALLQRWAALSQDQQAAMRISADACYEDFFNIAKTAGLFFDILQEA